VISGNTAAVAAGHRVEPWLPEEHPRSLRVPLAVFCRVRLAPQRLIAPAVRPSLGHRVGMASSSTTLADCVSERSPIETGRRDIEPIAAPSRRRCSAGEPRQ
jgi:hypothetical protein